MVIKIFRYISTAVLILSTILIPSATSGKVKAQGTEPPTYYAYLPFISLDLKPLVLDNYTIYSLFGAYFYIYGEVTNPSTDTIMVTEIPVYVVDANNQILETTKATPYLLSIPSNGKTCFSTYVSVRPPDGVNSIKFGTILYQDYLAPLKNVVSANVTTSRPSVNEFKLTGFLRNDDTVQHTEVAPVITIYYPTGKVMGCNTTTTTTTLDPSQQSPFTVSFYRYGYGNGEGDFPTVGSYNIQMNGR